MAAGWAISSALALGLAAAHLALSRAGGATGPAVALLAILAVASFTSWSYAFAVAAHGSKGGLLTLLGHALVGGLGLAALGARDASGFGYALPALLALAALGAAWTLARETRARRGPANAGAAILLTVPTALLVGLLGALQGG